GVGPAAPARTGGRSLVGLRLLLVRLALRSVLGLRRGALALEAAPDPASRARGRLLGGLADRAPTGRIARHLALSQRPHGPARGVLDGDPRGLDLVADPVRTPPILPRTRLLPLRQQPLHQYVDGTGESALGRVAERRPGGIARVEAQHIEHV